MDGKDTIKNDHTDTDARWEKLKAKGIERMGQEWWEKYGEESLKAAMVASGDYGLDDLPT